MDKNITSHEETEKSDRLFRLFGEKGELQMTEGESKERRGLLQGSRGVSSSQKTTLCQLIPKRGKNVSNPVKKIRLGVKR